MNAHSGTTAVYRSHRDGSRLVTPPPNRVRHWVSETEWRQLEQALDQGRLPPDFAAKLTGLRGDNLRHRQLAQDCRLVLALLDAAREDLFPGLTPAQHERLVRALAYVRKDEDAIPDYRPDGFIDDHQEVRAVCTECHALLHRFKLWRLRHQVPGLWTRRAGY